MRKPIVAGRNVDSRLKQSGTMPLARRPISNGARCGSGRRTRLCRLMALDLTPMRNTPSLGSAHAKCFGEPPMRHIHLCAMCITATFSHRRDAIFTQALEFVVPKPVLNGPKTRQIAAENPSNAVFQKSQHAVGAHQSQRWSICRSFPCGFPPLRESLSTVRPSAP